MPSNPDAWMSPPPGGYDAAIDLGVLTSESNGRCGTADTSREVQWSAEYVGLGEATGDRPAGWYLIGTPRGPQPHRIRLRVQDSPDAWWGDTAHGLVALLGAITTAPSAANRTID